MLDSTIKTIIQTHRVWSACVAIIGNNPEAREMFAQAIVGKLTAEAIYAKGGDWSGIHYSVFDVVLKEHDKAEDAFKSNASRLCDMLYESVSINMRELVSREMIHDILSAILYKALYQEPEDIFSE